MRNSTTGQTAAGRINDNLAQVPVGMTINRTIFGWSAWILARPWNWELLAGQPVYAGLQTVRSGYGGTIPHPDSQPLTELSPPGERWLFYEVAILEPAGTPDHRHWDKSVLLRTVGTLAPKQCETQVLNTYAAQTLNVYVSIACPAVVLPALELQTSAYTAALWS
jgi:hypothetical protein